MAIPAYSGLQGSGKSYNVVQHQIIPSLKDGRPIYTNIPLSMDLIDQHFPDAKVIFFEINDIKENEHWFTEILEKGSLFVLDEAWKLWPAGLKAVAMNDEHKQFIAEHRHWVGDNGLITQPVIVTQDLKQVCAYLRDLINTTYHHTKMDAVGQQNKFRVDTYGAAVTGQRPSKASLLRSGYGKYSKDVYQYYVSQTQSKSVQHGIEESSDKRANILQSFGFKFYVGAFVSILLGAFFVIPAFIDSFSSQYNMADQDEVIIEEAQEVQATINQGSEAPLVNSGLPESQPVKKRSVLSQADQLLNDFRYYISWNNGHYPEVEYKVTFQDDNFETEFTVDELELLEFAVSTVNECTIILKTSTQSRIVLCSRPDHERVRNDWGATREAVEI